MPWGLDDTVPRHMFDMCTDTLKRCLASRLELQARLKDLMPQPKKKPKADNPPEPLEIDDQTNDDDDEPEGDEDQGKDHHEGELKIVIKQDVIEIDLPRDGNEVDTLQRIAQLVDDF